MILVAGDAMLDRYWIGDVSRISPEAPVPVVKMGRTEERPGAAANVAANCRAMGAQVDTLFSPSPSQVVKIRVIGRNQQMVRVDFDEPQEPISAQDFADKLNGVKVVVFSDYGKGALKHVPDLINLAKRLGKTVLVDPKGHDYQKYRGAGVVKPNKDEMREMVGGWGEDEALLAKKAERMRRECGLGAILLTRASEGMTLFDQSGATSIPCTAREVFDVSGAGDTAIAALAVGLSRGMTLKQAAHCANRAAGKAVAKFGTAVITEHEVFGE